MKKALIIGGGFSGCAAAHLLSAQSNWSIDLVEIQSFLGAGNRTQYIGGHPHTFGPRHFLTTNSHIFDYLNKYVPMKSCAEHEFLTYVEQDKAFYNYPIHRDDIERMPEAEKIYGEISKLNTSKISSMSKSQITNLDTRAIFQLNTAEMASNFEEYWIKSVGKTLYEKFVNQYSKKMWQVEDNRQIDDFSWSPKGVTIKEGERACWSNAISAYPIAFNGYDDYFRISTKDINVLLNTKIDHFDIPNKTVYFRDSKHTYDIIINTISPDILFDYVYGELPYIGRTITYLVLPVEFALPKNVYFSYYAGSEEYTRVVEYKKFTKYVADNTLISIEVPSAKNKHYPLPFESEKNRAKKYFSEMPDGVFSIGRAGSYLYNVDIDDAIEHAMNAVKLVLS